MSQFKIGYLAWIIVSVVSFFCAALIFSDVNKPSYYQFLPFVPLVFGIVTALCPGIYKQIPNNLGITLLLLLMFYRYVVLFIIMFYGDYMSVLKHNIAQNINTAILLAIYEIIAVFCTISYVLKRNYKHPYIRKRWNFNYPHLFNLIIVLFVIVDIAAWILIPAMRGEFRSIFDMNEESFVMVMYRNAEHGSFEKILATLFSVTFGIVRLLVPMILINKFSKWFKRFPLIGILLSGGLIFVQLLFVSSTIASALICCVLLLMYTSIEFPKQRKLLYYGTMASAVIFVGFYFYSRYEANLQTRGKSMYEASSFAQVLSMTQNAYFSGIDNIAASCNNSYQKYTLGTLKKDIISTIPFNTTIFGQQKEDSSAIIYKNNNGFWGQIPTTIGMGYSYLGFILAPIFSIILTYICVSSGCKFQREKDHYFSMVYLATIMYSAMGIVMYNFSISGSYLFSVAFILYCLLVIKGEPRRVYSIRRYANA